MDLVAIGAYVAVNWVYIDGVKYSDLQLSRSVTSVPGGANVLDTRWHSADNEGFGWPDGLAQFNPVVFNDQYSVCFNKLHYGSPPDRCTRATGVSYLCAGDLSTCTINGEIDGVPTVAELCWKHTGEPTFVATTAAGPKALLPYAKNCVALADTSIAVHVHHLAPNATLVKLNAVETEQDEAISALIAFGLLFLLIVWNDVPRRRTHAWLDADIVIAAAFINWARYAPPAPAGCDNVCSGSTCSMICSVAVSSYLLALVGLSMPFALVSTACWRWPMLSRYVAPTFTHASVEIVLLASSAAHFPAHRIAQDGEVLLLYVIAAALCVVTGRTLGAPSVSYAELGAKIIMIGLVWFHSTFSLLRPALQLHPSLDPADAHQVLATSGVLSTVAVVTGFYAAKCSR